MMWNNEVTIGMYRRKEGNIQGLFTNEERMRQTKFTA